jgi:adenosylcobinamide-phosphate synthase
MTTVTILAIALLADALIGEPEPIWKRLPHPVVLMGKLVSWLDTNWNRGHARRNGIAAVIVLIVASLGLGLALAQLGPWVELICATILLAHRSLVTHVRAVAIGTRNSLQDGRKAVSMIVSRETAHMSETDISRSALESLAENFSDGVIAPAFWFLIGGLPGMILYKWINTADSMIGYKTPRHAAFGWAAARLDDLLNLVPARLSALILATAARALGHWTHIKSDARLHRSPNAGWPEAALAYGMSIALAGPRIYDGALRDLAWVNAQGRRELTAADIDEGIAIVWKGWSMCVGLCVLSSLIQGIF